MTKRFVKILIGCVAAYFSYGIVRAGIGILTEPELAEMAGQPVGIVIIIIGVLGAAGSIMIIRKAIKQKV